MYPISVPHLQQIADPFENVVWHLDIDSPITRQEVHDAIAQGRYSGHISTALYSRNWNDPTERRRTHAERIAHLVTFGWHDAIMIDVGIPSYFFGARPPYWPVTDGNHRLAAAIYRCDPYIAGDVVGCVEEACRLGLGPPGQVRPPLPMVING
ncbi:hypothetical protein CcrColossus_gp310 [Caulobacter phage CcrColossus]|uniref:Uncharacterized protein n=1 Tax=Caulobacter phage CcrColossus TaxID=1211640 RepID=K4JUZ4_9CAUD|nr:hypothetical protein CcrColossus_gp310 [Caulobacter phage CcrColossus]AFU88180.1 hypothetical protein CcrColossus_gp310 [Caulobacter phage CcrColossus]